MMVRILNRTSPDEEFSWLDSYRAPFVALVGLKEEVMVRKMSDFASIATQINSKQREHVRELLEDALSLYPCVRLVPAR